jgi:hypothetical protein
MGKNTKNQQNIAPEKVKLLNELSLKIEDGLKEAWHKLVIKTATNNQSLVVMINGEIKTVPAKELLANLEGSAENK